MTEPTVGERGCTRRRIDGKLCRGRALPGLDVCSFHARLEADPEAARAAGRRGGAKTKQAKKGTTETFGSKVNRWFKRAGDEDVDRIMGTPQGAAAALRFAELELEREPQLKAGPLLVDGRRVVGWLDLFELAIETGQAHLFGIDPVIEETVRAQLAAGGNEERTRRSPVSSEPLHVPEGEGRH